MKENSKIRSVTKQSILSFSKLGKEIKISPKAHVSINDAGFGIEYGVDTISVLIGIGKDHTAELIMDVDAWKALKKGEEINITTEKEFKNKYL